MKSYAQRRRKTEEKTPGPKILISSLIWSEASYVKLLAFTDILLVVDSLYPLIDD